MAGITLKKWLADLPHQFNALPNWEVLIRAFSDELDEVYAVFEELDTLTCIDTATGKNLDMIGDIVHLSRNDAFNMLPDKSAGYADDEAYRACIKYQVTRLNSDCTYADLRTALALLLGEDNKIKYKEEAEHPATVILETDSNEWDEDINLLLNTPVLKAGGVGLLVRVNQTQELNYGTGIATQSAIWKDVTMDRVDFDTDIICLADEGGVMLCDEEWNLLIDETSVIQGEN